MLLSSAFLLLSESFLRNVAEVTLFDWTDFSIRSDSCLSMFIEFPSFVGD
jgi:hypothetical protein